MEIIPPDAETILEAFKNKCEIWVDGYYKIAKKKSKFKKILKDERKLNENIQKFVYNALIKNIDDGIKTLYSFLFPDLFHKIIETIFEKKQTKIKPLFHFGRFHLAFKNFHDFKILEVTIELIKNKLLEGECNTEWIDIPYLKIIYNSLSVDNEKKLRFLVRNLILLGHRNRQRAFNEDINIIFKN